MSKVKQEVAKPVVEQRVDATIREQIDQLEHEKQKIEARRVILLDKAVNSEDPEDLLKAQTEIQRISTGTGEKKSYLLDPQAFMSGFGFKDRPMSMSYGMLRSMSRTSIINSIIRTRINQVAAFAQPQADRYSIGYEIRKKAHFKRDENEKPTKQEEQEIAQIIEFLENGSIDYGWETDDFDTFLRKITRDTLTYDQMTFEIVRTKGGKMFEFFATDASTFRIADSFIDEEYRGKERKKINGYYPSYVQIFQNRVVNEFYPWESCFGIRNPQTDVYLNGYGVSELEELAGIITALLWGEDYNRRFFKQGSAPKGILKVSGNVNETKLQEFKQQWNATMRGVQNAWKTPILEADKMEWIDLQRTNRDMEFSNWIEFLIKISCAVFLIDPAEINFPFNGSPNESYLFEGSNDERLKFSKDKGLAPLVKFIQKKLNKYLINQLNPKYELIFKGIDSTSPKDELELDDKAIRSFTTVNEIRLRRGMDPIPGGDIILDGTYLQKMMMDEQNAQQGAGGPVEDNPVEGDEPQEMEENPMNGDEGDNQMAEENPITKAFNSYFDKFLHS